MTAQPLHDTTAIVTGAGKGIGRAVALVLSSLGARIVAGARTASHLDSLAREIEARGGACATVAGDVGHEETATALADAALSRFGGCDVLINAAGVQPAPSVVEDLAPADWRDTFETNVTGTFLTCRAVLPDMKARGTGRILNVSSGLATRAQPGQTAYSASKAAVLHFSTVLAEEVRPFGIHVNSLHPGIVRTAMVESILSGERTGVAGQLAERLLTLEKEGGLTTLEDSARFIAWLASADTESGAFIRVDDPDVRKAVDAYWMAHTAP